MEVKHKAFCSDCDVELEENLVHEKVEEEKIDEVGGVGFIQTLRYTPLKIINVKAEGVTGVQDYKIKDWDVTFHENVVILPNAFNKLKILEIKYITISTIKALKYNCSCCGGEKTVYQ